MKRSPFDIEKSSLQLHNAANAEELAEVIEERFGPPESDEESHLFNTTLEGADINPLDVKYQRPKR